MPADGPLPPRPRVRRHPLLRLAGPEERAHRAGRARTRRCGAWPSAPTSRATARAAPTSGVHALHQVAHLDLETRLPPETLRRALNDELPADIHLLRLAKVTRQFHARHSAVARSYLYQISRRRTAFGKPFVWWIRDPLDAKAIAAAGRLFEGMHDFRSYSDADPARSARPA